MLIGGLGLMADSYDLSVINLGEMLVMRVVSCHFGLVSTTNPWRALPRGRFQYLVAKFYDNSGFDIRSFDSVAKADALNSPLHQAQWLACF